jgi:hypothetical protein
MAAKEGDTGKCASCGGAMTLVMSGWKHDDSSKDASCPRGRWPGAS